MEEDNNNYTRVQQSLEVSGLEEYFEKFKQHQMDDEIMIQLVQDVDLSQNLQRLIPVLGHEMKFKLEFKKLCGDEIPIKLPLHPYLQQEMMDYEFLRSDARHLTSRRGRGRAKSKTTSMSEMKAKTLRKPPKDRTTNKFKSNGSLNTIKRRGRPPKIWPSTVTSSSSSSDSSNGLTSFEGNHNEGEEVEHGGDCPYSPGPGPNGGTASTSPPIKKPRGRPALKKNKQVINSFYQRAQQDDNANSPTKNHEQEQQQEESLKAQNSSENQFKRPRGRPPKKANTKQNTAKKQTNEQVVTERLSGVKYEINNGFPFEQEELEEMPLIHDTALQVNEDEQDFVGSKFDSMSMPILSMSQESTLSQLVDLSPIQKINLAVKSSPILHARKQVFILKSESESLTENLIDY